MKPLLLYWMIFIILVLIVSTRMMVWKRADSAPEPFQTCVQALQKPMTLTFTGGDIGMQNLSYATMLENVTASPPEGLQGGQIVRIPFKTWAGYNRVAAVLVGSGTNGGYYDTRISSITDIELYSQTSPKDIFVYLGNSVASENGNATGIRYGTTDVKSSGTSSIVGGTGLGKSGAAWLVFYNTSFVSPDTVRAMPVDSNIVHYSFAFVGSPEVQVGVNYAAITLSYQTNILNPTPRVEFKLTSATDTAYTATGVYLRSTTPDGTNKYKSVFWIYGPLKLAFELPADGLARNTSYTYRSQLNVTGFTTPFTTFTPFTTKTSMFEHRVSEIQAASAVMNVRYIANSLMTTVDRGNNILKIIDNNNRVDTILVDVHPGLTYNNNRHARYTPTSTSPNVSIDNLTPNTEYSYRFVFDVLDNSNAFLKNSSEGSAETYNFKTLPPRVTANVSDINHNSVKITVNYINNSYNSQSFTSNTMALRLYNGNAIALDNLGNETATFLTGLTPGQQYTTYRPALVIKNTSPETVFYGANLSFTTQADANYNVSISNITPTSATITAVSRNTGSWYFQGFDVFDSNVTKLGNTDNSNELNVACYILGGVFPDNIRQNKLYKTLDSDKVYLLKAYGWRSSPGGNITSSNYYMIKTLPANVTASVSDINHNSVKITVTYVNSSYQNLPFNSATMALRLYNGNAIHSDNLGNGVTINLMGLTQDQRYTTYRPALVIKNTSPETVIYGTTLEFTPKLPEVRQTLLNLIQSFNNLYLNNSGWLPSNFTMDAAVKTPFDGIQTIVNPTNGTLYTMDSGTVTSTTTTYTTARNTLFGTLRTQLGARLDTVQALYNGLGTFQTAVQSASFTTADITFRDSTAFTTGTDKTTIGTWTPFTDDNNTAFNTMLTKYNQILTSLVNGTRSLLSTFFVTYTTALNASLATKPSNLYPSVTPDHTTNVSGAFSDQSTSSGRLLATNAETLRGYLSSYGSFVGNLITATRNSLRSPTAQPTATSTELIDKYIGIYTALQTLLTPAIIQANTLLDLSGANTDRTSVSTALWSALLGLQTKYTGLNERLSQTLLSFSVVGQPDVQVGTNYAAITLTYQTSIVNPVLTVQFKLTSAGDTAYTATGVYLQSTTPAGTNTYTSVFWIYGALLSSGLAANTSYTYRAQLSVTGVTTPFTTFTPFTTKTSMFDYSVSNITLTSSVLNVRYIANSLMTTVDSQNTLKIIGTNNRRDVIFVDVYPGLTYNVQRLKRYEPTSASPNVSITGLNGDTVYSYMLGLDIYTDSNAFLKNIWEGSATTYNFRTLPLPLTANVSDINHNYVKITVSYVDNSYQNLPFNSATMALRLYNGNAIALDNLGNGTPTFLTGLTPGQEYTTYKPALVINNTVIYGATFTFTTQADANFTNFRVTSTSIDFDIKNPSESRYKQGFNLYNSNNQPIQNPNRSNEFYPLPANITSLPTNAVYLVQLVGWTGVLTLSTNRYAFRKTAAGTFEAFANPPRQTSHTAITGSTPTYQPLFKFGASLREIFGI